MPDEWLTGNGGGIAIGDQDGRSGGRMDGHEVVEGKRRGAEYAVVTVCIGGGKGAAGVFEIG